ncbi:MAG: adenosine deaminase [Deltaproteobacteria bacterium]|nr:adenosine deaminase [Deltaproteobacteria bacterium]
MPTDTERLIRRLPKAELHLHIEGTLEPEMMFSLAAKHGIKLPFASVDAVRAAYNFHDLQSFLDLYYAGCDVLRDRKDFYALAMGYFTRAHADGVEHAELFFDPQTHTIRGIAMEVIIGGLRDAMDDAHRRYGITSELILCFLRHLSEADAIATLEAALPFRSDFIGVGLDSGEYGNPPSKFQRVYAQARALGLRLVAHAGEEGPAAYIYEALDLLGVERIDHGVRCDEDPALVERLVREQVPLTVCPLSNLKLRVVKDLRDHNFATLLRQGVAMTINSDDPAYFGGYIADNYRAVATAQGLTPDELVRVAENAVRASFLPATAKTAMLARVRTAAARA